MGGQWRIAPDDLKKFMGIESFESIANRPINNPEDKTYHTEGKTKILISAVVDINVTDREEALRISSTIMAAMNSRDSSEKTRCDYLFFEEEGKADA